MKVRCASNIGTIALSVLLFASVFVVVPSGTSYAEEEQAPVNTAGTSAGYDEEVAAASGSNRFVVWQDDIPTVTAQEIFFRRSTDNGATWKPVVNLSNNPGGSNYLQIVVSGSNVYVVWSDSAAGNLEVRLNRSTDNGATWKGMVNLSNNLGMSILAHLAA